MALGQRLQDLSRADFLRSVGLYVMQDRLVMVRLRKSLLNVALLDQQDRELPHSDTRPAIAEITGWVAEDVKEIALKAENDSRERSLRQAIVSLLPHFNAGAGRGLSMYSARPGDRYSRSSCRWRRRIPLSKFYSTRSNGSFPFAVMKSITTISPAARKARS